MPPYIAREASKVRGFLPASRWGSDESLIALLGKRVVMEFKLELKILLERWKFLLLVLAFQYLHGVAAKGAHFLHQPGRILPDVGFRFLPELGLKRAYMSESVFFGILISFILWTLHPFVFVTKKFYTVTLWYKVLVILMVSQLLRILSFLATSLPGPNYHCHEGSPNATLPPPKSIWDVVWIDLPYGVIYGCGDLIFSSHMIFTLVFVWTYQKYGSLRFVKRLAWLSSVVLSLLIIASRKHYTVDIVVAWYTVGLVFFFVDQKLPDDVSRESNGPVLPIRSKDTKNKEETQKLMNGNAILGAGELASDWRQRAPINGKVLEDKPDLLTNGSAV